MVTKFETVMRKLATLGHNPALLTDCSEVIPVPQSFTKAATFPAGITLADVEQACTSTPFPSLKTDPGPATAIPPV